MDFYTALKEVAHRQKIKRLSWEDPDIYVDLQEGVLSIHNDGSSADAWIISMSDLKAEDWIMYEEDYDPQF